MGRLWRGAAVAAIAAAALATAGCGNDDEPTVADQLAEAADPDPADFPKAAPGKTLRQFAGGLDTAPGRLRMATSVYNGGHSRIAFAVLRDGEPVYGPTVIYASPLAVDPPEVAGPTAANADLLVAGGELEAIYDARAVDMHHRGPYALLALTRDGDELVAAPGRVDVLPRSRDPLPIDARLPVPVAGTAGRPAVIVLSDTDGCQDRACESPTRVAAQLERRYGDRVAFVEGGPGLRRRLGLPAGPWVVAVDSAGRVAARMEGAIGTEAFERAAQAAIARSPDS
jgi:hypothetical protein